MLACLLGAGFALGSFGRMAVDPSAVQWLLISDRGQSFLGWHMARNSAFSFPLGSIPSYVVPGGASLALTDSYPVFSVPMLLLSPLLPPVFQHAGIWLVLCYALIGLFSYRLLRQLMGDGVAPLVGTCLVVINPVLLFRRFHLSLCAHWLIAAAFVLYFSPGRRRARWRFQGALLLVIASGTHPYLAAMVLGLVLAAAWARRESWGEALATGAAFVAITFGSLWAFGYLAGSVTTAPGFGDFSTDLLSLVDPDTWSRVLPDIPSGPGEYEGFAFLGIGVLSIIVIDLALAVAPGARGRSRSPGRTTRRAPGPLLAVALAFGLFALSSKVRLGAAQILDLTSWYSLVEPVASTFRASGRFIWPLYYLVLFGALAWLWRLIASRAAFVAIVLAAVALQLADAWPRYSTQSFAFMALANDFRPLRARQWHGIGAEYEELRLIPPAIVDTGCDGGRYPRFYYMPFALLAGLERMRINSGHLSRYPAAVERWCAEQTEAFAAGRVDPEVVYVVSDEMYERSGARDRRDLRCGVLDGHHVCVSAARSTPLGRSLGEPRS